MRMIVGIVIALIVIPIAAVPLGVIALAAFAAGGGPDCTSVEDGELLELEVPGQIPGCPVSGELGLPLAGEARYYLSSNYGPRSTNIKGASKWHPAVDLGTACGRPVLAMQAGLVVRSDRLWMTIRSEAGHTISYLHTEKTDRLVRVGDMVYAGQHISSVGNVPPSSGCHLDVRIYPGATTDPRVKSLVSLPGSSGYIDPEEFTRLFGIDICSPELCTRRV